MAFATDFHLNGERIDVHSWDDVQEIIHRLKQQPGSLLFMGANEGSMILEYVGDQGYYVSAFGHNELDESLAWNERAPGTRVVVTVAGQPEELPRRVFVSDATACAAAQEFYQTGRRSADCTWVPSRDVI